MHQKIDLSDSAAFDHFPEDVQDQIDDLVLEYGEPLGDALCELLESAVTRIALNPHSTANHKPHAWSSLAPDELVLPKEASKRLKLSTSKLAKMRCTGNGPQFVKLGARTVMYRVKDVDAYLKTKLQQSTTKI